MGFGKETPEKKEFKPTTKEEWKAISKRARQRDEERDSKRAVRKENSNKKYPKDVDAVREALLCNGEMDIRIYRQNFFEEMVRFMKEGEVPLPAYHAFEEERVVRDARFRYDLNYALSRMSWMQHAKLISTATGLPIPSRDWSEAWHMVQQLVRRAFDIRQGRLGNERIKDLDALEDWPVSPKKRKVELSAEEEGHKKHAMNSNERAQKLKGKRMKDTETLDMFDEDEKKRLKAKKREENREVDTDDEDDTRDDKAKDDDDDEKPKRGKKSRDDDDDDDEKPKRGKKSRDDDDDDEPAKKRKEKSKMSKEKKSGKSVEKKVADDGDETVYKVTKKFKGGIKEEVQTLIKGGGSTLEQVVAAAKKAEIDKGKDKIKGYLAWMVANGYLKKVA